MDSKKPQGLKSSLLKKVLGGVSLLFVGALALSYYLLVGSLPILDGEVQVSGLQHPITIERDALGVATIRGESRADVVRGLGFLHGQERFFLMDVMRRYSTGHLADLLGPSVLKLDQQQRMHRIQSVVRGVYERLTPKEKENIMAYSDGVNAGIQALRVRPFEYLVLGKEMEPWSVYDCVLVGYVQFFGLEDSRGSMDFSRGVMKVTLPPAVYDFLVNNGSRWEAPHDYSVTPIRDIPGAEHFRYLQEEINLSAREPIEDRSIGLGGSNQWAVDGTHTPDGSALIACDMHLNLSVPNIWYRATLIYPDEKRVQRTVSGVTLSGAPLVVAGTNTHIAWGFTNSFTDTADLVIVETHPEDPDLYKTRSGWKPFQKRKETIFVNGEEPVEQEYLVTEWGPLLKETFFGHPIALKWVGHDSRAFNLRLIDIESVESAEEALEASRAIRMPLLNFMVADRNGDIGWTLVGNIPKRQGYDGSVPVSFMEQDVRWGGIVETEEHPTLRGSPEGRLWTANNRAFGGEWSQVFGQGVYRNGMRAYQIRERLRSLPQATPQDMLAIQMDDEAWFFVRWQKLMLKSLKEDHPLRSSVSCWDRKCAKFAKGYKAVKRFRKILANRIMGRVLSPCYAAWDDFAYYKFDFEEPIWLIASKQPDYLVDPEYGNWESEIQAVIDETSRSLEDFVPEEHYHVVRHPFSAASPWLGRLLDISSGPITGDYFTPKMLGVKEGASQRLAVSPGKEEEGILQIPCGQSCHLLSPHYSDHHKDWVEGKPTPLLPGETEHTLVLFPG